MRANESTQVDAIPKKNNKENSSQITTGTAMQKSKLKSMIRLVVLATALGLE